MRCFQHGQPIQYFLGTDLLNDPDQCIADDDRQECQISKRTYQTQQNRQNQKDQVEIGKYIIMNNLFCRKSRWSNLIIGPAILFPYPDLLGIKTYPVVRNHTLDLASNDFFLLCFFFFFSEFHTKNPPVYTPLYAYTEGFSIKTL